MVNYKLGKIYKIVSPSHPEVPPYFGSTCDTLSRRMSGHRKNFNANKSTSSKSLMCFDDAVILLVEEFPCDNIEQLRAREGQIMLEAIERSNIRIAGRTSDEYKAYENKRNKERHRLYNVEHKEDILLKKKQYYQEHKDELKISHAKYNFEHKERLKEYKAHWYQEHKEESALTSSIKITCECGSVYAQGHKSRHLKTVKHLQNLPKE